MKSLEERLADRARRKEQAEEDARVAREVLATGTLAEGKIDTDAGGQETPDYSNMTKDQLKEELESREIEFSARATKEELIALLEQHDADSEEEEEEET